MRASVLESTNYPERLVCQTARGDYMTKWLGDISFEEAMKPVDGENMDEKKNEMITRLLERGHFGPFEHPHITFTLKDVSRVAMAQMTRHRHASFDVQSLRYTAPEAGEDLDEDRVSEMIVIPPDFFGEEAEDDLIESSKEQFEMYQSLLDRGYRKEDARFALPMATAINMSFTVNARSLMHILDMRMAGDAQWEVRRISKRLFDLALDWMPNTFGYYDEEMNPRRNRLAP